MNPGKLNKRITIRYYPVVDDGQGGRTQRGQVLTELCKVWAEFEKPKTTTEIQQGGPVSVITQPVIIRRRDDVRVGYKLIDGRKEYEITNVYDLSTDKTVLVVKEVARRAS